MTKAEERAWKKAEKASQAERKKLLEETRASVIGLLGKASDDVTLILAGQPTDHQQWRLSELNKEISRVLAELGGSAGQALSTAAGKAWDGGISAIDKPMVAAEIRMSLPHLDTGQLMAMRTFMVDRLENVSSEAASKIRSELGLAMIGSQSVHETIGKVGTILGEGGKARATTIVRTELSRAWATASHERALQSEAAGVAMDKIWRRSGKVHSRFAHDLADGRRIEIDKPFMINGHAIRYPHDPQAPASETINCGCVCLYRPRDATGTLPDKRPFSDEELARNPNKAELAAGKSVNELMATPSHIRSRQSDQSVARVGREIHRETIEHAAFFDTAGKEILRKSGGEDRVDFSPEDLTLVPGSAMLHNHPGLASFSPEDNHFAMHHQLAETTVVDWANRYTMKPDNAGWSAALWQATVKPLLAKIEAEVTAEFDQAIAAGLIDQAQADGNLWDEIWRRLSSATTLKYTKERL